MLSKFWRISAKRRDGSLSLQTVILQDQMSGGYTLIL